VSQVASVPAKPSSAFTFTIPLRADDLTDESGQQGDTADAASLAWRGRRILCLPKEQPRGKEQPFTLTVTDSAGRTGTSGKFYIEEEATMGDDSNTPEIDATLTFKWWDETVNKAPPADSTLTKIAGGRGVDIYVHPSEPGQVLRELREFPSTQKAVREFFKDLTVWQLVGGRCGGKVAQMTNGLGWYFDRQDLRAGFCMRRYDRGSLDEQLTPKMKMSDRFGLCDQVLEIMVTLDGEFPKLMFPDIKPKNFLCQSHTSDALRVLLTDLDDVRRVDSRGLTSTTPYRHPDWEVGAPTKKLYEQYSVAVTLLQILLGMRSEHEWSPADYVQSTFVAPYSSITGADVELCSLRDYCPTILTHLAKFFTRDAGNLKQEEGEEGESRYSQMRDEMKQVADAERDYRAAPATSRGGGSNGSFTIVCGGVEQVLTTEEWQGKLTRMVGRWESDLMTMTSFKGDYRGDLENVRMTLKELKRSVGQKPGDLSRKKIIGSVRDVVEAVLAHLARWMKKDPRFDPSSLSNAGGRPWPNIVLDELRSEMRAPPSARKLEDFYHTKLSGIGSWAVRYGTNIERLCNNLKDLRDYSHKGHHAAEYQETSFYHDKVHSQMERLGLLFSTTQRPFVERRMLN